MPTSTTRLGRLAAVAILLVMGSVGCSDPGTKATSVNDGLPASFCRSFSTSRTLVDLSKAIPRRYSHAASGIETLAGVLDTEKDPDAAALAAAASALTATGVADQMDALATAAMRRCPDSEGIASLRAFATVSSMIGAPKVEPYCAVLGMNLVTLSKGSGDVAALAAAAPKAHRSPLAALKSVITPDPNRRPDTTIGATAAGAIWGLALYADTTCGDDGVFVELAPAGGLLLTGAAQLDTVETRRSTTTTK
ncbi:MAG: hypothetical protein R2698_03905 [Microthrixaceae bacterium]